MSELSRQATPVAALPVSDLKDALEFYIDTLGMDLVHGYENQPYFYVNFGTGKVFVYASAGGCGGHTAVNLDVTDVNAIVSELSSRGVSFTTTDDPDAGSGAWEGVVFAGDDGTRNAWFTDPDGNRIRIVQWR